MSSWIDKAKDFVKGHPDQTKDAVEKAEDFINDRTGGKYADQVDQGSDALGEQLGLPPDAEDVPAPIEPAPPVSTDVPIESAPPVSTDVPTEPAPTQPAPTQPAPTSPDPQAG